MKWYETLSELQSQLPTNLGAPLDAEPEDICSELYSRAIDLSEKPDGLLSQISSKGTLHDRLMAMDEIARFHPLQVIRPLKSTIHSLRKLPQREIPRAIKALVKTLVRSLIPSNRKLIDLKRRSRSDFPTSTADYNLTRGILALFYFESEIKMLFAELLQQMELFLRGNVDLLKTASLDALSKFLVHSPEQEDVLLKLIVNKLGDTRRLINGHTVEVLAKVTEAHSAMFPIIVREIENLVFRPNVLERAKYYGVVFLVKSFRSSELKDQKNAENLLGVFLSLFRLQIKLGEMDSRLLKALIGGISEAYSLCSERRRTEVVSEHVDDLFRVASIAPFATRVQVLLLLSKVVETGTSQYVESRTRKSVFSLLLVAELARSRSRGTFLNIVYRIIKQDEDKNHVFAFIRRLLQVSVDKDPDFICAVLILLSQILKARNWSLRDARSKSSDDEMVNDYGDRIEIEEENEEEVQTKPKVSRGYSPWVEDPSRVKSLETEIWEITEFLNHYHTSVRIFAEKLIAGKPIRASGNPFEDFDIHKSLENISRKKKKDAKEKLESSLSKKENGSDNEEMEDEIDDEADEIMQRFFELKETANALSEEESESEATEKEEDDDLEFESASDDDSLDMSSSDNDSDDESSSDYVELENESDESED